MLTVPSVLFPSQDQRFESLERTGSSRQNAISEPKEIPLVTRPTRKRSFDSCIFYKNLRCSLVHDTHNTARHILSHSPAHAKSNILTCSDIGPPILTYDTLLATKFSFCDKKFGINWLDGGDNGTQWVRAPNILFAERVGPPHPSSPYFPRQDTVTFLHIFSRDISQRLGPRRLQFRHYLPIESPMLTARSSSRMPPVAVPPALPPVGPALNAPGPSNYMENGRMYGGFRKGKYMFPNDEVIWARLGFFAAG